MQRTSLAERISSLRVLGNRSESEDNPGTARRTSASTSPAPAPRSLASRRPPASLSDSVTVRSGLPGACVVRVIAR